ncbi:MAG: cytochrome c oxidase subunit 3 family protein [Pseudomonadota bacterium]|nr:cytochrome c oxidase subunit 3 family protein [Pseudomonadota bacterium]
MSIASDVGGSVARKSRRIPGEEGLWIFIFGDALVFSVFFVVLLLFRGSNSELYSASQEHLNQAFGVFNTALLLSSSWLVAMAVKAARRGLGRLTPILMLLAVLCGGGFAVVKVLEWSEKIGAGITLITNDFFMYYFIFTGIHFLHVMIGMAVLTVLALHCRSGVMDANKIRNLESGASFWHLVDLLWIVLFALFYLVK